MKKEEANHFLSAFGNETARSLVFRMMTQHYAEAILEHHPAPASLNTEKIRQQTRHLCTLLFEKIDLAGDDPSRLIALLTGMSRAHQPVAEFWFEEFNEAYENYKHHRKLAVKLEQLLPFLRDGAYADIGCGGGDLVCHLKDNYGKFSSYTGIDVMDWRSEAVREKINFRVFDFSGPGGKAPPGKYDFATCLAVLHHVGRDETSQLTFLRNIRESLHPRGRLLVEEDVILPADEISSSKDYMKQMEHLRQEQMLYGEYTDLGRRDQEQVLILIDLLANSLIVGVPDMDFPFGFRSIHEWERLFREAGFVSEKIQINGFVAGTFNRSSHVVYLLRGD